MQLTATLRLEGSQRQLPVTGWQTRFDNVAWNLALPPGWHALYAGGADSSSGVWLTRWSMLDCFLLLITAFAAARVLGWATGLLTFVTLVLLWQEASAPSYVWLFLLAGLALLRLAPPGGMPPVGVAPGVPVAVFWGWPRQLPGQAAEWCALEWWWPCARHS